MYKGINIHLVQLLDRTKPHCERMTNLMSIMWNFIGTII